MPQSRESRNFRHGLTASIAMVLCSAASAQTDSAATLDRQTDEAFRQVQQQPQDLTLWSKYADLLIKAGNYEGGIAAMERLLLNPDAPPGLRVQVALLYYRLGSYAMAETMARDALADSRLQGAERTTAEQLLQDTLRRNQRNQLSGVATFGLRHQSNPTYRSDAAQVLSGGVLGPLAADQRPAADNDLSLGLRLLHQYDLDLQNSATIYSTFGAYLVDYRSSSGSQLTANPTKPYDLQVLDLTTGLQFKPSPAGLSELTLRPHLILSNVVAQGHQYLRNQGLGLDASWRPNERTLVEATLDRQRRDFSDRVDIANADLISGHLWSLRARVSREVAAGQVVTGDYVMRRNRTGRDFYDFDSHELRVSYALTYASPMGAGRYWTTVLWAGGLRRSYGAPDPSITSADSRRDREWRFGVSQNMPLTSRWSLQLSAEQARNQANLPNFRYKNTTLSGVAVLSF